MASAAQLREIQGDITEFLELLHKIADTTSTYVNRIDVEGEKPELVAMVGLQLHNFYTAVEDLFQRITNDLNGVPVSGSQSHLVLLKRMARPVPNLRPAIISSESLVALDELRRFRHVFRHAYTYLLQWNKMEALARGVPEIMEMFEKDLSNFNNFLKIAIDELMKQK